MYHFGAENTVTVDKLDCKNISCSQILHLKLFRDGAWQGQNIKVLFIVFSPVCNKVSLSEERD